MITENMTIKEIIREHPETKKILKHYGLLFSGCG